MDNETQRTFYDSATETSVFGQIRKALSSTTDGNGLHDLTSLTRQLEDYDENGGNNDSAVKVAVGVSHVLRVWAKFLAVADAASVGTVGRPDNDNATVEEHFAAAIMQFNSAWGSQPSTQTLNTSAWNDLLDANDGPRTVATHQLQASLNQVLNGNEQLANTRGFRIVNDMLLDGIDLVYGPERSNLVRTIKTPILLKPIEYGDGLVATLTIELIEDDGAGVIDPNPFQIGLTVIDEFMKQSINEAWMKAGPEVLQHFRARWSISNFRSLVTSSGATSLEPKPVPNVGGPSAQAAALIAIWAAAGTIPDQLEIADRFSLPGRRSLELLPDAAVSAVLGEVDQDKPLADIPLLPVGGTDDATNGTGKKLHVAAIASIDPVVIASDESESAEETNAIENRKQATADSKPYTGPTPPLRVNTIGQAANLLLVVNRWLYEWDNAHTKSWENEWDDYRIDGKLVDLAGNPAEPADAISTGSVAYMRFVSENVAKEIADGGGGQDSHEGQA